MSALASALLHLLWQGALVGIAVAAAQPWLLRRTSAVRYRWLCGALAALPAMFALTLATGEGSGAGIGVMPQGAPSEWVVAAWGLGMLVVAFYTLGGWLLMQRLRRNVEMAVPEQWLGTMARLRERLGVVAQVRLGLSRSVAGPCVIGCWRPWILLPAAAAAGLPVEQLEAVLAHELAHIRRHDYLVHLLQRAVEIVFFYHPVVWWLSHRVSEEREHCCDDLAVEACGDRAAYARALVDLAEWRTNLAMAAAGGSLRGRVRRLLNVPGPGQGKAALWAGAGFAALMLLALGAGRLSAPPAPPMRSAPAVVLYRVPRAAAKPASPPVRRGQPKRVPVPVAAAPRQLSPPIRFSAVAFVPACGRQVQWVPQPMPDGTVWLVPRTITQCELVVLTTT